MASDNLFMMFVATISSFAFTSIFMTSAYIQNGMGETFYSEKYNKFLTKSSLVIALMLSVLTLLLGTITTVMLFRSKSDNVKEKLIMSAVLTFIAIFSLWNMDIGKSLYEDEDISSLKLKGNIAYNSIICILSILAGFSYMYMKYK